MSLYRFSSSSYTSQALLREYMFPWSGVHGWIVPSQRISLMQFMLDVVVFVINKYKNGKTPGSHKAIGECAQHHSFYSFESLWPGFWDTELEINSKFVSYFSCLFLFRTILPILHLFLKCCLASCAPHSYVSFAAALFQTESMVCAHTNRRRPI